MLTFGGVEAGVVGVAGGAKTDTGLDSGGLGVEKGESLGNSPKMPEVGLANAEGVVCKPLKAPLVGPGVELMKMDEPVALGGSGTGEGDLLASSPATSCESAVFDGIANGVFCSGDSAGFPNVFVVTPDRLDSAGLDESPTAQTGFAAEPPFDAAAANALWAPDANAPKPNVVVDCWVLENAEGFC